MARSQKAQNLASLKSQLGSTKKMPDQVKSTMEQSFRTDLSGVNLFESPMVDKGGANAVASGKDIAFAPGKLDFGSTSGRELLGHELSHVVSQGKGEVGGHGVVHNSGLESKADAEGAKAAASFGSSQSFAPMSQGMGSLSSTGPVQCSKKKETKGDRLTSYFNELIQNGDYKQALSTLTSMQNVLGLDKDRYDESEMNARDGVLTQMTAPEHIDNTASAFTSNLVDNSYEFSGHGIDFKHMTTDEKMRVFYQQNSTKSRDRNSIGNLMGEMDLMMGKRRNGQLSTKYMSNLKGVMGEKGDKDTADAEQMRIASNVTTAKGAEEAFVPHLRDGIAEKARADEEAVSARWKAPWADPKKKKHRFRRWLN